MVDIRLTQKGINYCLLHRTDITRINKTEYSVGTELSIMNAVLMLLITSITDYVVDNVKYRKGVHQCAVAENPRIQNLNYKVNIFVEKKFETCLTGSKY
jgi:hypothetical protein